MTNDNIAIMDEIWKPISGYEGLYEVSNMGRVRRLGGTISHVSKNGLQSKRIWVGRILRPGSNRKGYLAVALCNGNSVVKFRVARLVAMAFVFNADGKPQVNHIDGDRTNNEASNLEWVTNEENQRHSWEKLGRQQSGAKKRPVVSCLDGKEVKHYNCIRAVFSDGYNASCVDACLSGKQKTHGGLVWKYSST